MGAPLIAPARHGDRQLRDGSNILVLKSAQVTTTMFTPPPPPWYEIKKGDEWLTFLGLSLNVLGSFLTSGAFILQKLTHNDEAETHFCCRWRWWLGFVMLTCAGLLEGTSLAFTPLSIVAPLSGLTVLLNTVFAVCFLKETYRWIEAVIVGVLAAGIACTTTWGPHKQTKDMNAKFLQHTLYRMDMGYYYIAICFVGAVFAVLIYCYQRCHHVKRLHAFGYGMLAACLGGQQNMFLKCGFLMIKQIFAGHHEWTHVFFWETLGFVLVLAFAQISILNMGLAQHDAVSYIPIYQAALVVFGVLAGGVFFSEFKNLVHTQLVGFCVGIGLIVLGLLALTAVPPPEPEQEEQEVDEEAQKLVEKEELTPIMAPPLEARKDKLKAGCCA